MKLSKSETRDMRKLKNHAMTPNAQVKIRVVHVFIQIVRDILGLKSYGQRIKRTVRICERLQLPLLGEFEHTISVRRRGQPASVVGSNPSEPTRAIKAFILDEGGTATGFCIRAVHWSISYVCIVVHICIYCESRQSKVLQSPRRRDPAENNWFLIEE